MRIRVYETGNLDLGTVAEMLCQTDRQTNFDPASRWIDYTTETITTDHFEETGYKKKFKEIFDITSIPLPSANSRLFS